MFQIPKNANMGETETQTQLYFPYRMSYLKNKGWSFKRKYLKSTSSFEEEKKTHVKILWKR